VKILVYSFFWPTNYSTCTCLTPHNHKRNYKKLVTTPKIKCTGYDHPRTSKKYKRQPPNNKISVNSTPKPKKKTATTSEKIKFPRKIKTPKKIIPGRFRSPFFGELVSSVTDVRTRFTNSLRVHEAAGVTVEPRGGWKGEEEERMRRIRREGEKRKEERRRKEEKEREEGEGEGGRRRIRNEEKERKEKEKKEGRGRREEGGGRREEGGGSTYQL
jgi:hypothetical protein